jgi:hypothetical protein
MVEMYGLAQIGQAPLRQPMNRCSTKPRPAPRTTETTVRTNNQVPLSDGLEPGPQERIRASVLEPIRQRAALTGREASP